MFSDNFDFVKGGKLPGTHKSYTLCAKARFLACYKFVFPKTKISVLNFNASKIVCKIWVTLAGMILNQGVWFPRLYSANKMKWPFFMFRILWRFWKLFWMLGQLRLLFVQIHVENRWRHRNLWIHWKRRRTWLLRRRSKCCVCIGIILSFRAYLLKGFEFYETIAVTCNSNHHFNGHKGVWKITFKHRSLSPISIRAKRLPSEPNNV